MGITVLKIIIYGRKLSVLWSQIAFYDSHYIYDHQTDDLPRQMTILKTVTL